MKANTPSLILFFVTSVLAIIFKLLNYDQLVLYVKSIVIPSLFIYYFVSNNYKISFLKAMIFLLFFAREVFLILQIQESAMGAFLCVLLVYILLLFMSLQEIKRIKFSFNDTASVFLLIIGVGAICYSVLSLKLENLELDFSLYVLFGVVLSTLGIISILNYIKSASIIFFNSMLMCVCFMISDIFFVVYKFYYFNRILTLFSLITQFLSYFFMVKYFLEKNKENECV